MCKQPLDRPVYHNNFFVTFAMGLREWSFTAFFLLYYSDLDMRAMS